MKKYFQAPWNIKDLITSLLIAAILIFPTIIFFYFLDVKGFLEDHEYRIFYLLGLFLLQSVILFAPILFLTWKKYKLKSKYFGFKKIKVLTTIKEVIGAYLVFIGITFLITIFIIFTNIKIPGYQIQENVLEIFGKNNLELIIAGIIVIGIAPVLEEIFFRGFLLRTLVNKGGILFGTILTAAIFAVFHMQWQSIIPLFILGLIINHLVIRNKTIWPAIVFHVFNNAVAFTLQLLIIKEVIKLEEIV